MSLANFDLSLMIVKPKIESKAYAKIIKRDNLVIKLALFISSNNFILIMIYPSIQI